MRQKGESSKNFNLKELLDALQEQYPEIKVKVNTIDELDDSNKKAKETRRLHEHVSVVVKKSEKSQGKQIQDEPKGNQGSDARASLPGIDGLLKGVRPMK